MIRFIVEIETADGMVVRTIDYHLRQVLAREMPGVRVIVVREPSQRASLHDHVSTILKGNR